MTTVMVTSSGRRRYVLEELIRHCGPGDQLIAADMSPLAPSLSTPGVKAAIVHGDTLEERVEFLCRIVEKHEVDALLSLHDYEAIELSQKALDLASLGCLFIGPSVETSRITLDKRSLATHIASIDSTLTPRTLTSVSELVTELGSSPRWILKDRWGSASSGLTFADADSVVQLARDLSPETWVAQPHTEGVEYNVDLFYDLDGSLVGACTKRKWTMRGGETDSATVLIDPPHEVLSAARRAVANLDVTGNVDVDVILGEDRVAVVIDVNPRFGGGYAFSALAGYTAGEAIWQLARGERPSTLKATREVTAAKHVSVSEVIDFDSVDQTSGISSAT